jgi:hypothetical protein
MWSLEKPYLANRCRRQTLRAFKGKFRASEESFDVDTLLSRPANVALTSCLLPDLDDKRAYCACYSLQLPVPACLLPSARQNQGNFVESGIQSSSFLFSVSAGKRSRSDVVMTGSFSFLVVHRLSDRWSLFFLESFVFPLQDSTSLAAFVRSLLERKQTCK